MKRFRYAHQNLPLQGRGFCAAQTQQTAFSSSPEPWRMSRTPKPVSGNEGGPLKRFAFAATTKPEWMRWSFPNLDLLEWLYRERYEFWDKYYRRPSKLNISPLQWHLLRFQVATRTNSYTNVMGKKDTAMGLVVNIVEPIRVLE